MKGLVVLVNNNVHMVFTFPRTPASTTLEYMRKELQKLEDGSEIESIRLETCEIDEVTNSDNIINMVRGSLL